MLLDTRFVQDDVAVVPTVSIGCCVLPVQLQHSNVAALAMGKFPGLREHLSVASSKSVVCCMSLVWSVVDDTVSATKFWCLSYNCFGQCCWGIWRVVSQNCHVTWGIWSTSIYYTVSWVHHRQTSQHPELHADTIGSAVFCIAHQRDQHRDRPAKTDANRHLWQ